MIKVENLTKVFNKYKKNKLTVLKKVNLTLPRKGLVSLLGASGSGKTTFLNLIGGLDKQSSGCTYINNSRITKFNFSKIDKIRAMKIGYIFQDYKLLDDESVFDNVALSLKLIGIKNKKEIKERVNFVLEKLDILRYRYRPAASLSGGERQRVGIARALVKDPDIILADEPTGNLDSKNSLEIMKIISQISKEKLVILVTHEQNLAKFYSDRIIELSDGNIVNDYINDHPDDLDYQIENKFYLKDFKNHESINDKKVNVNVYSNDNINVKIDIVVKNNSFYIKTNSSNFSQIVDEDSNIEFINDKYKKINKNNNELIDFNYVKINKKKYCSVFKLLKVITSGFKKVFSYKFMKKAMLIGSFLSSVFITYATCSYVATLKIHDEQFLKENKSLVSVSTGKNNKNEISTLLKYSSENHMIAGDSTIDLNITNNNFAQFIKFDILFEGSVAPITLIDESDIILGRLPKNNNEIVIDKFLATQSINNLVDLKAVGLNKYDSFLNQNIKIDEYFSFKVVGISDTKNPSIYVNDNLINDILNNANNANSESETNVMLDYTLFTDKFKIKKGRMPKNEYEVILHEDLIYEYKLNKSINYKVNNKKLKVVGFYKSDSFTNEYLVNNKTIFDYNISKFNNIKIYDKDPANLTQKLNQNGINAKENYKVEKDKFIATQNKKNKSTSLISIIILSISLIEIYLLTRASFISKIKEIGIYRAIGVKKTDICKLFIGEAFAITTLSSIPGVLICSYVLNKLTTIKYMKYMFVVNPVLIISICVFIYIFNILISLLPAINVLRKTPANILSRNDVQ